MKGKITFLYFILTFLIGISFKKNSLLHAQNNIAINSTGNAANLAAGLDINFTNKGLLIPRLTFAQRTTAGTALVDGSGNLPAAAQGLLVYQTNAGGSGEGFYYNTSTTVTPAWVFITPLSSIWSSYGNANTVDGTNFLGTTDNIPLNLRVFNAKAGRITSTGQTFLGYRAGNSNTVNTNTAIGYEALFSNITGVSATAIGYYALHAHLGDAGGWPATAIGAYALASNTDGVRNTAAGFEALYSSISADENTATGSGALRSNTSGYYNTAAGYRALYNNKDGISNTGVGYNALYGNTSGDYNVAVGSAALNGNTSGQQNVGFGSASLLSNMTGSYNTAIGYYALSGNGSNGGNYNVAVGHYSLYNNKINGNNNVSVGKSALYSNKTACNNIAIGNSALYTQSYDNGGATWNSENLAIGHEALYSNQPASTITGYQNTATGNYAMRSNITGKQNTAYGYNALRSNTSGDFNTAVGHSALYNNRDGVRNTATGYEALYTNGNGDDNTAIGFSALRMNTAGDWNTALGRNSLVNNTSGTSNTAAGTFALGANTAGIGNTALGYTAGNLITDGDYNTCIGYNSDVDVTGRNNCIVIGSNAPLATDADNKVRIGTASTTSIGGQVGWTTISDERVKEQVKEDVKGLDFIMKLKPVTYNYNVDNSNAIQGRINTDNWVSKYDIEKMRFSGFLAQEVEKAAKEAGYDFSGVDKPADGKGLWTLRYAEFTVPLIKAMQEQEPIINNLRAENKDLKTESAMIKTELEELKAMVTKALQSNSSTAKTKK